MELNKLHVIKKVNSNENVIITALKMCEYLWIYESCGMSQFLMSIFPKFIESCFICYESFHF
jgi:hypothetical protein